MKSQSKNDSIKQTVNTPVLTVGEWRERYTKAAASFGSTAEIAKKLSAKDEEFEGSTGYFRIQNLQTGRAGLQLTAKAVLILENLINSEKRRPRSVSRQKLGLH